MNSSDPLLQPFTLKHLTLKNRIISTSHEPAYSEDGFQKRAIVCITKKKPRVVLRSLCSAGAP
ncbi:MAG: hypothetical protein CM1200mP18_02280 [Gammaproteobacteria bacterium]|nr:MAG: hypothetical protein CM1200mP18_02280 [Gammaproteobacteria bacterium]